MKSRASQIVVALVIAGIAAVGCKKKDKDGEVGPAAAGSASASAASAAAGSAAPVAAPPAGEVSVADFTARVAPTTCKMLEACKNDKVKATLSMSVMLVASFGSMDKPDLAKEMQDVSKSMKAEKRFLPNEAECTTTGNVALKVVGMTPDKVGKTLAYDAKKGAACLASIAAPPEQCKTEVKLATEPKFKDIDAFGKELHDPLEAYAKPCEDVITGMVDIGGACDSDVECKGKGNKCQKGKDPKVKTKSCQAKASGKK